MISRARLPLLPALAFLLVIASGARGAPPPMVAIPNMPTDIVRLKILPDKIVLRDRRSRQQLVVMATDRNGYEYDVSQLAQWQTGSDAVSIDSTGVVRPLHLGAAQLTAQVGDAAVECSISVDALAQSQPVSFVNDVMAVLGKSGCNAGACHGHASGKGGFKLSLRGYDPAADHQSLLRQHFGRRIDLQSPEQSLILRKPMGELPHGGGRRLEPGSESVALLRQWINDGAQEDLGRAAKLERLEVLPGDRLFAQPGLTQQLIVRAYFADGATRDVTAQAIYELTNDDGVARVDEQGRVTAEREGETAVLIRFLGKMALSRVLVIRRKPEFVWKDLTAHNFIDEHVFRKLRAIQVLPSELSTDVEFLRRVSIDTIGVPPTSEDVRTFLADRSLDKRARKIDQLLADDQFGEQWALYWLELSGATESGASVGRSGMWALYGWLRDAFNQNLPYDRFLREIVAGKGSVIDSPPAAFGFSIPRVEAIPQAFLGMRVQCAQCHDHPFDVWTQHDYNSLARFFTNTIKKDGPRFYVDGQTLVPPDKFLPWLQTKRDALRHLDGSVVEVAATKDYREALADWMLGPARRWTARAIANRVWGKYLGRGIVEPVDDMRFSNPPVNEPLLDALADEMIEHRYDFKHLARVILNSHAYQASSSANATNADDLMNFSHAPLRRLTAEQLLDALSLATGIEEEIPGAPQGTRAAQWAPLNTGSRFLETFGRPVRRVTACTCERTAETTLSQSLHLMNGTTVETKLRSEQGAIQELWKQAGPDSQKIEELYLRILSRSATRSELKSAEDYLRRATQPREGFLDLAWAFLNSQEFLFNH
ncbi:MAG: DUF1549 and DUF1553 domain-containing protein [Planctomycetia bacterium]|nr:DUF1549 and DUF1553 domain-containing protein [Planctomycetia bacterium]